MLQISKDEFDKLDTKGIIELITPVLEYRKKMYSRYNRKNDLNSSMNGGKDENGINKTIVPFEYYITNMAKGYLGGKAPVYTTADEELGEKLEVIRNYNDDTALFTELLHDYLITASAYLYVYKTENDAESRYIKLDSRQTVVLYDYSTEPQIIACVRYWAEIKDGNTVDTLNIIDATTNKVMQDDKKIQEENHQWKQVPVIAFENSDNISVFEPAITEIDQYEQIQNNIKNYTQCNDDAKLIVTGFEIPGDPDSPEYKAIVEAIFAQKVLTIPRRDGGTNIEWLLKDADYTALLEVLKSLHQNITMLTGVPNMTDESFGNASSGVALGYKLYALEQYSSNVDRVFKKGYMKLIELLVNRMNLLTGKYNASDVKIQFQRNVPNDKAVDTQAVLQLYDKKLISLSTAIGMLPYDIDVNQELDKIKQEQEEEYNSVVYRGGPADENVNEEVV